MFGSGASPFGTPSSTSAFGTPSSMPSFGAPSSTPPFGTPPSTSAFGAFGTPSSASAFGTPSSTPFATPSSTPSFGGSGFGSLFSTPQPQQQQTPLFSQPSSTGFGFQSSFATFGQQQQLQQQQQQLQQQQQQLQQQQFTPFPGSQLTTQMAPVAPLPFSLADRDIQAIVDAYKEEPGNPKYAFKHLLFSVTDPQFRGKPAGVSDIMWAEAMAKLEGMESTDRERLWPQLVNGFKDLSQRLKLQDEVIISDAERLRMTQSNVKMLQRHLQADTLPWIERMRQKEQSLQRRLLRVMRILEALQGKGYRLPLVKGEADLAEKLVAITGQLKGSGGELSRKVQNLLAQSRAQSGLSSGSLFLPGSTKVLDQSLADLHEVLQQQTEAIARLGSVLKRDIRDMEIIMSEDSEMAEDVN